MLRHALIAILVAGAGLTSANAYAAEPAPAAAAAHHYTTGETDIGTLLADPAAKAIIAKHMPDVVANDQISAAAGMTFKQIQPFAGDAITDELLAKVDADLAKLPAKH